MSCCPATWRWRHESSSVGSTPSYSTQSWSLCALAGLVTHHCSQHFAAITDYKEFFRRRIRLCCRTTNHIEHLTCFQAAREYWHKAMPLHLPNDYSRQSRPSLLKRLSGSWLKDDDARPAYARRESWTSFQGSMARETATSRWPSIVSGMVNELEDLLLELTSQQGTEGRAIIQKLISIKTEIVSGAMQSCSRGMC